MAHTPMVLIIRDGWGENPNPEHDNYNAVKLARTPVADQLTQQWPHTLIRTSGEHVGLPQGTMGNSEVGHQNIGAGRVVDQESVAITKACRAGLEHNAVIAEAIREALGTGGSIHLMGICSDAGVHGMLDHLFAVLEACKALKFPAEKVFLHLFTDGRDTGPFSGLEYALHVEQTCRQLHIGRVVSIIGRYFAMDRDNRWERVQQAYECLTGRGSSRRASSAEDAIRAYYDAPTADNLIGDEYIPPTVIASDEIDARATRIKSGDSVIFYNYRGDRPREISAAFVFPDDKWAHVKPSPDSGKHGFDRGEKLELCYVTMTAYWAELAGLVKVAFPKPPKMVNIAGDYISKLGLTQFRCAETEKYPHVTFFFNDYRDEPFEGEHRVNPQSPRVSTYDLKPEMAAGEVCEAVLQRLDAEDCESLLVVNFANGDMVGHTGNLQATIRACEVVDQCVGRIVDKTMERGGMLIITADHGNAEQMWDPVSNAPHTSHTTYDVPMIVVGERFRKATLKSGGRLADLVPTALAMMGLEKPSEMTGESLLIT